MREGVNVKRQRLTFVGKIHPRSIVGAQKDPLPTKYNCDNYLMNETKRKLRCPALLDMWHNTKYKSPLCKSWLWACVETLPWAYTNL